MSSATQRPRVRVRRVVFLTLVAVLVAMIGITVLKTREYIRFTSVYDPPVRAGQMSPVACSAGFYARLGHQVVITTSAHCGAAEGSTVTIDGRTFGVQGPGARLDPCPSSGHACAGSDMSYVTVQDPFIPWGHLNLVDLGAGGYRILGSDSEPLACDAIAVGAKVEVNGLLRFREGAVTEKGPYDFPSDTYFPCMVVTSIGAQIGDSGGAVLVDGRPAGIAAREFGDRYGFTPLAPGLEELGLVLCTEPDCGLVRPTSPAPSP